MIIIDAYNKYISNQNKKSLAKSTIEDCKQKLKDLIDYYQQLIKQ